MTYEAAKQRYFFALDYHNLLTHLKDEKGGQNLSGNRPEGGFRIDTHSPPTALRDLREYRRVFFEYCTWWEQIKYRLSKPIRKVVLNAEPVTT